MAGDEFFALEAWFARKDARALHVGAPTPEQEESPAPDVGSEIADEAREFARERAISESCRWYARLHDALDAACERMLCDLAAGVLARELALAPCDLVALSATIRRQMLGEPLRVRLHPEDYARWEHAMLPACEDATLSPGDALFELREGSIDARLGVRLQAVLDACTP